MDGENDDLSDLFRQEWTLSETGRSIALAETRCLKDHELIDRIFGDPELGDYLAIRALKERGSISQGDQSHLLSRLKTALNDSFRSRLSVLARRRSDRLLLHLGRLLQTDDAVSLAITQAGHRLVGRQRTALTVLRKIASQNGSVDLLRSLAKEYGDDEALILLTKFPGGLKGYACCELVANANPGEYGNYFESLILERMGRDGQLDFGHVSQVHPGPFIRAIGRMGNRELSPYLTAMVGVAPADFLPMAASVAGRLRDSVALEMIRQRCATLRASLQPKLLLAEGR